MVFEQRSQSIFKAYSQYMSDITNGVRNGHYFSGLCSQVASRKQHMTLSCTNIERKNRNVNTETGWIIYYIEGFQFFELSQVRDFFKSPIIKFLIKNYSYKFVHSNKTFPFFD